MLGLCFALVIPFLAYYKRSITALAAILASSMLLLAHAYDEASMYLMILSFLVISIVEKATKKRCSHSLKFVEKTSARDGIQILANGGIATICMLGFIASKHSFFLVLYAVSIAEALADSSASAVGVAYGKQTYDICRLKRIENGISGGVTWVGTLAAFASCALVGVYFYLIHHDLVLAFVIVASSFFGCMMDSVLGSSLQRKNKCEVCGLITEKTSHCHQETAYYSGLKFLNNDAVNFISNLLAVIAACLYALG